MHKIPAHIVNFFQNQGCVVVSTIDKFGFPHSACKGIVKLVDSGVVYLLDLYRAKTFENLKNNPRITITAFDEHKFIGYSLKGKARLLHKFPADIAKVWEERITSRLTQRLLRNIREEKGHPRHPEVLLPKPEYLIVMKVAEVVDLAPQHLK